MDKKKFNIIIDSNIWISSFFGNYIKKQLNEIIINDEIIIFTDEKLRNEIIETLKRPKFQKYITKEHIRIIFRLLEVRTKNIIPVSNVTVCRDSKDDFILALCKDVEADYLITGDKDLLVLNKFENTNIITIADFNRLYLL